MAAFDPDKLRRALPRLDLAVKAPLRDQLAAYASHYGLAELVAELDAEHYLGTLEAYGYDIATQVFLPAARPRGTLLVMHGYFDHVGLYRHVIRRALARRYVVVAFDLPGHGLSSGARGSIPDFQHYQEVLADIMAALRPQLPAPWVAQGQSTGAAILMDHVLAALAAGQRPQFVRVQLLAPLVRIAQWRKIRLGQWLLGRLPLSVPRHFRRSSQDPAFLDFLWRRDPLQFRRIPMAWLNSMVRWERHIHALPRCRFPVTLIQGERDETVDWRYNVGFVASRFFVEAQIHLPEASHHLVNEREDLREQLLQAMDSHVLK